MNQTIGAAMYLVLALAVAVGIRAMFSRAGSRKELNSVNAGSRRAEISEEAQRRKNDDLLPWIIPPALAPAENTDYRRPVTCEEISEMFKKIDLQLSQDNRVGLQ